MHLIGLGKAAGLEMPHTNVTEIAAERQRIMASINSEADVKRLYAVERKIAAAAFRTDADKLAALAILLEQDDRPHFADEFKNQLFLRLQGMQ
jgi:hypothetical protein